MNIFSKLFGNKSKENQEPTARVGGMEDYLTLIRVYTQAAMAAQLGISNIRYLPDLAAFKRTLKIPTQNNKLGIAEKAHCKKMLTEIYGIKNSFFKETDSSIKKNCKTLNDVPTYLSIYQTFSQDLMTVIVNLMQWKLRVPFLPKKLLESMTNKTVHDILTKTNWKDDSIRKTTTGIRQYQRVLGFSEEWICNYFQTLLLLARKEPKPKA